MRTAAQGDLAKYANMIADPCNAQIYPGIFGSTEGSIDRARTTLTLSAGDSDHSSGYILWCPDYDNNGDNAGGIPSNVWIFYSDNSSQQPLNTDLVPYGRAQYSGGGALLGSAEVVSDPMNEFLNSGAAADSRTISACIAMTYTGSMFDASGEICYVEDSSLTTLLHGSNGNPVSVDDLFSISPMQHRFGVDKVELKFRPTDSSEHFRNSTTSPLLSPEPAATTFITENAKATDPAVYGIAWRGLKSDAPLSVILTKLAEWRPQPSLGLIKAPPNAIKTSSKLQPALALLDKKDPHWSKKVLKLFGTGAKWLAKTAFTGIGTYFGGAAGGQVGTELGNAFIR